MLEVKSTPISLPAVMAPECWVFGVDRQATSHAPRTPFTSYSTVGLVRHLVEAAQCWK